MNFYRNYVGYDDTGRAIVHARIPISVELDENLEVIEQADKQVKQALEVHPEVVRIEYAGREVIG